MRKGISLKQSRGFTLIEIMIVVIIIGIMASIAYPAYQDHVRRGHQAQAQGQMMELASALEEHRAKNFTYNGASLATLAPALNGNDHYNAVLNPAAQSYTITSTPSSKLMSGMPTLTLDNTGAASWDKTSSP